MSKRISRRQLKEDEVLTALERAFLFVSDRRRDFGFGAAIVVAIFIMVIVGISYRQSRNHAASHMLSQAMKIYDAPVLGETRDEEAPPPDKTYPSRTDKLREALTKFTEVAESYPGTTSARVATYYTGLCQIGLGDAEQAAQALTTITEDREPMVAGLARLTLATLARDRREPEKAAELLRDQRYAHPADAALFFRALALEDQGLKTAAIDLFKELQKTHPDSAWVLEARTRVEELQTVAPSASEADQS